jgi:transcription elongation factor Elf1
MTTPTDATHEPEPMECPRCGCQHFERVRTVVIGSVTQRRGECRNCGRQVAQSVAQKKAEDRSGEQ